MSLLESIVAPSDLQALSLAETADLAAEIRDFLVENVAKTGGHLGPNLGVVELTIALHRVFESPRDTFLFDTGHQSYVHKLLTGRQDFSGLRQRGGLAGYPNRAESEHDVLENSHASAALSWADGVAKANQLQGRSDRFVVTVVGDGSLTGGMAWEALNNIAESNRPIVIVVNDNGRSYAPTIGGLAHHLDTLRTTQGYEQFLKWGKRTLWRSGAPGKFLYFWLRGLKKGIKDVVAPQGLFEDLGIKYIGPVDGHSGADLERALVLAKGFRAPVIVHAITEKGRGYAPAERHVGDRFHAVGRIHPETGLPVVPSRFGWTAVFADELVRIGRERADVVAVTAAMLEPVGLVPFASEFPERTFDVGIAEQHAVTSAAGLAFAGLHPVVCVYATFLNRAFDQVLLDVGLHRAGVTFALDRAGITGDDGPSHNGMWDLAWLRLVPGIRVAAPRDEATLRLALRQAVEIADAPTVVRYPKGELPPPLPAIEQVGGCDVLLRLRGPSVPDRTQLSDGTQLSDETQLLERAAVLLVGYGAFAPLALEAAHLLAGPEAGVSSVTVASPLWVWPTAPGLVELADAHDLVVTLEDGLAASGVGADLSQHTATPVSNLGLATQFYAHASREQVAAAADLTPTDVVESVTRRLVGGQ